MCPISRLPWHFSPAALCITTDNPAKAGELLTDIRELDDRFVSKTLGVKDLKRP
jgi:hypothetical protein